jgi:hypothetical protein
VNYNDLMADKIMAELFNSGFNKHNIPLDNITWKRTPILKRPKFTVKGGSYIDDERDMRLAYRIDGQPLSSGGLRLIVRRK